MNNFGITKKSFELLISTFDKYPQIEEVVIFGSRAKGNYKNGSDIDLAIKGEYCSANIAFQIAGYINEELPIPYNVDVVDYNSLDHTDLREHINRIGKNFYIKMVK